MRPGFTFRDRHSGSFPNLFLKTGKYPLIPAQTVTRASIPGRSGELLWVGDYGNKLIELQATLAGGLQERRETARELVSWLSGTGKLWMDYEPERYYQVLRPVSDVSAIMEAGFDIFTIRFECEPYQYGAEHEDGGVGAVVLENAGTAASDTVISLRGNGMVKLGDKSFSINNTVGNVHIDSKRMIVYSDIQENLIRRFDGEFIQVPPGLSTMETGAGIENITVRYIDTWL